MNSAVQNMVISLGAMQLARKLPLDDPEILTYVRLGYVGVQALVLLVYYFVSIKIKSKNDLTVLKFVEPPSPLQGESEPKLTTTTIRDYDLGETSKGLRGVYTSIAMMGFLHLYMGYTQPLFVQGLMGLKNLYDSKEFQIHVLGWGTKGEEEFKRPFKGAPGMFGGAASGPVTDAKAIEDAEKKATKKDD